MIETLTRWSLAPGSIPGGVISPIMGRLRKERENALKKVEQFLENNNIEFDRVKYGSYGYYIPALRVTFYFDGIGNTCRQKDIFKRYMKDCRNRSIVFRGGMGGAFVSYVVMTSKDAQDLDENAKRLKAEHDNFWKEEHARRTAMAH